MICEFDRPLIEHRYNDTYALNSQVLNPGIDDTCSNLWLDTSYCVAPVGNIASYSGYTGTATLPFSLPDFTPGPSTKAEWDTSTPTSDPEYPVIPLANETRVDCWR